MIFVFSNAFATDTYDVNSQNAVLTPEEKDKILNSSQDAIACLTIQEKDGGKEIFAGTGFFIHEEGILLTAYHVVYNAEKIFAQCFNGQAKAPLYKVIYCDRMNDFCILQFSVRVPRTISLRSDLQLQKGEKVYTLGFVESCKNFTIQSGSFFKREQIFKQDYLTATTAAVVGNSGGPMLDRDGNAFGVVSFISSAQEPPETHAIPIINMQDVNLGQEVSLSGLTEKSPRQSFFKGMNLFLEGEYAGAIAPLTEALETGPDYNIYLHRGMAFYRVGRMNESLSDMNNAIDIAVDDQERSTILNIRGLIYKERGDFDKALDDFNRAIELLSINDAAFHNRGLLYDLKGEHKRAIADYSSALAINSQFTDAYYDRGLSYHSEGNVDNAIADYTKALEIDLNYANVYLNRAVAYYQKGDITKSRSDAIKAKELGVNVDPVLLRNLGI